MFSSRLPAELSPNAFSRAVRARRAAGGRLLDLTETNPTAAGIPYPADLLSSLGDVRGQLGGLTRYRRRDALGARDR